MLNVAGEGRKRVIRDMSLPSRPPLGVGSTFASMVAKRMRVERRIAHDVERILAAGSRLE